MSIIEITTSKLFTVLVTSLIAGLLVGGGIGYTIAPRGGGNFDLPDIGTFRMGFIPANPSDVNDVGQQAYELMQFLSDEMGLEEQGIEIEVYPVNKGYEDLILGFQNDQIDAAFMDATPAYITVSSGDAEVVMAELQVDTEATFYRSGAWVSTDSPINNLTELVSGKYISSHTSWTGSSGMVIPVGTMVAEGYMSTEGVDETEALLNNYFTDVLVGGGYAGALQRVIDGNADVAFIRSTLDNLPTLQENHGDEVRLLHTFGKAPSHPVIVNDDFPEGWKTRFISAMLKLNQDDNFHILKDLYNIKGLVGATNLHLEDIGTALDALPWVLQSYQP